DHIAALVWLGTTDVLTLMVLQQLGPEASAYYFMANTIAYGLYLVTSNIGSALVAEGARSPDRIAALTRAALRNSALLVLPAEALGIILTRPVLGLFGADYADQASALLQLLLASAVPHIVIGIALAAARLRDDLRTIALTYGALAVTTLGGSWVAVMLGGLNGVGVACLVSEVLVALLLLTGRSGLWQDRPGRRRLLSVVGQVPLELRRAWSRREIRRRLVPALEACGLESTAQHRLLTSDSDVLVVALDSPPVGLVVKIATSQAASAGLNRHADLLTWLGPELGASTSAARLPQVLYRGTYRGERVVVESGLPGSVATEPAADRGLDPKVTAAALAAIAEIHQSTAVPAILDRAVLRCWIDEPLGYLRRLPAWAAAPDTLDRLADALYESLTGRLVTAAVVHGNFWSGNVLVRTTESGPEVTGIVDWENARRVGLPDTDLVHWWLAGQSIELGAAVRSALVTPAWASAQLADLPVTLPNPQLAVEDTVLLTWLGHVSAGLAWATRTPVSPMWVARNIRPVVQWFATPRTRRVARAA
ncbi:MAG TPA: phosphotransferase, partial [Propionibacteriaceae bacterium]|nr:phosphotransferase [Propionibacteriaceae bacterium]